MSNERLFRGARLTRRILSTARLRWRFFRKTRIPLFACFILLLVCAGAFGFYLFEEPPIPNFTQRVIDSVWWAFVTLTTVGYGDIAPKTLAGRLVGVFLMFSGVILLSLMTAVIASIFVERKLKEERGLERLGDKEHIVICGWNDSAERILEGIRASFSEKIASVVLVNEMDEEFVTELKFKYKDDLALKFVKGDFTRESVLIRANVRQANSIIILVDTSDPGMVQKADERTILAALTMKNLNSDIMICAEVVSKENEAHLRKVGVDEIISRGEYASLLLTSAALAPGVPKILYELLCFEKGNQILRATVPQKFWGKTFRELAGYLRYEYQAILIAILSEEKGMSLDDILSYDSSSIDDFIRRKFEEGGSDLMVSQKKLSIAINPPDDYQIEKGAYAVFIAPEEAIAALPGGNIK